MMAMEEVQIVQVSAMLDSIRPQNSTGQEYHGKAKFSLVEWLEDLPDLPRIADHGSNPGHFIITIGFLCYATPLLSQKRYLFLLQLLYVC